MALSANTVWEVRNTADYASASDTNGGGFVTGASGTDWSYASIPAAGAAKYALTNGVTNGTTTIATVSASADMIGNIAYVAGGTGSITGAWYQITGQSTGVSITVDRSTGLTTGTGVTINIGGALATPGNAAAIATVSGMTIWVRYSSTAYSLTTATPGAGGPILFASSQQILMQGYDQARGDFTGNRPIVSWASVGAPGGNTYIFATQGAGSRQAFINLVANANSVSNACGFYLIANRTTCYQCVAQNATGATAIGFNGNQTGTFAACEASNCTNGFSALITAVKCLATGCTTGYTGIAEGLVHCVAYNCTTGFNSAGGSPQALVSNCTADTCTTGYTSSSGFVFSSSIASNCSGGGAKGFVVSSVDVMLGCAVYNNTTNVSGTPLVNIGMVTLTQQPYVTAGSQFAPNATVGGGASLRGAGIGVFSQTDNEDIGAVQHADPSGGGASMLVHPGMVGGMRG